MIKFLKRINRLIKHSRNNKSSLLFLKTKKPLKRVVFLPTEVVRTGIEPVFHP